MAQIRFEMGRGISNDQAEELLGPQGALPRAVNFFHYGNKLLNPGDITLAVSSTEEDSRAVITEGCSNWPKTDSGFYLPKSKMEKVLELRTSQIEEMLGELATGLVIVEANGICPNGITKVDKPTLILRDFIEGRVPPRNENMFSTMGAILSDELGLPFRHSQVDTRWQEVIPGLSCSKAKNELEVILPELIPEDDGIAERLAARIGKEVLGGVSTNCFVQAPNGTDWYMAA